MYRVAGRKIPPRRLLEVVLGREETKVEHEVVNEARSVTRSLSISMIYIFESFQLQGLREHLDTFETVGAILTVFNESEFSKEILERGWQCLCSKVADLRTKGGHGIAIIEDFGPTRYGTLYRVYCFGTHMYYCYSQQRTLSSLRLHPATCCDVSLIQVWLTPSRARVGVLSGQEEHLSIPIALVDLIVEFTDDPGQPVPVVVDVMLTFRMEYLVAAVDRSHALALLYGVVFCYICDEY